MSKIVILKEEEKLIINVDDNNYLFSYNNLLNIINEAGLPNKIVTYGLNGTFVSKMCNILRNNGVDAKSFNAFNDKDKPIKFIIKVKEKTNEKRVNK